MAQNDYAEDRRAYRRRGLASRFAAVALEQPAEPLLATDFAQRNDLIIQIATLRFRSAPFLMPTEKLIVDPVALVFDDDGDLLRRNLHGNAIDQILASEFLDTNETNWYLTDHLGTVRDIYSYDDLLNDIVNEGHIEYDSFGNIVSGLATAEKAHFAYTGREWDADAGLYYYRHRWYDPVLGQFISQDPIGFAGGDPNIRRYVENSPLTQTDPTGLAPLNDAKRAELRKIARDELAALMSAKKISPREGYMRMQIVDAALKSPFKFSDGGERNPEHWEDKTDPEGQYVPKGKANDAIKDAWTYPRGYTTGCKKATELIILRGVIELCETRDSLNGNTHNVDKFNDILKGRVPSDVMKNFAKGESGKFETSDFKPGDRVWMKNPHWFALTPQQRKNFPGEEGANQVYVGGGYVVSYNGDHYYDKKGLQNYILHGFRSAQQAPGAKLEDFQFERVYRPVVPSFIK